MTPSNESELQQLIQIEGPRYGCVLMRNNSGAMQDKTGRLVRYGLGNQSPNQQTKSSDLIGVTYVTVTPEMVGRVLSVFTAIEVKNPKWSPTKKLDAHEQHQKNFLDFIGCNGGIAGFCNSLDSFKELMTSWRR